MEKIRDIRVAKTRQAIYDALVELIQEKDLSRITIKELVERANINRKTFYNHYRDVYEVMDDLENILVAHFMQKIREKGWDAVASSPNLLIHEVIRELQENEKIGILLIYAGDRSGILSKIVAEEKKMLREICREEISVPGEWTDYFLNFFASGTMAVLETWFHSENRPPIQDISDFFDAMSAIFKDNWWS